VLGRPLSRSVPGMPCDPGLETFRMAAGPRRIYCRLFGGGPVHRLLDLEAQLIMGYGLSL
jgi:hypothetical protein